MSTFCRVLIIRMSTFRRVLIIRMSTFYRVLIIRMSTFRRVLIIRMSTFYRVLIIRMSTFPVLIFSTNIFTSELFCRLSYGTADLYDYRVETVLLFVAFHIVQRKKFILWILLWIFRFGSIQIGQCWSVEIVRVI